MVSSIVFFIALAIIFVWCMNVGLLKTHSFICKNLHAGYFYCALIAILQMLIVYFFFDFGGEEAPSHTALMRSVQENSDSISQIIRYIGVVMAGILLVTSFVLRPKKDK